MTSLSATIPSPAPSHAPAPSLCLTTASQIAHARLANHMYSATIYDDLVAACSDFTQCYKDLVKQDQQNISPITMSSMSSLGQTLLVILHRISLETVLSSSLNYELACDGAHAFIKNLLKLPPPPPSFDDSERTTRPGDHSFTYLYVEDIYDDIQQYCSAIASTCHSQSITFPSPRAPLPTTTLLSRQPKPFPVPIDGISHTFLISQIHARQSSQEDVGFVMWPAALLLSLYVAANVPLFAHNTVLELGAGCGLTGLVCGKVGATSVTTTDYNEAVLANLKSNVKINELEAVVGVQKVDFYESTGIAMGTHDVVVAADVICKDSDAGAAAASVHDSLRVGGRAYVVSGTGAHRFGVDLFNGCAKELGLKIESEKMDVKAILGVTTGEGGEDEQVFAGLRECAGFVDDMTFWFHKIERLK